MSVLNLGDLSINGEPISYEGQVDIQPGSKKRSFHPQSNGQKIITSDFSTNMSKITVTVRCTPDFNDLFDTFFRNEDNNTIVFRDKSFVACGMEELPSRKDLQTVDYVFFGDPAV